MEDGLANGHDCQIGRRRGQGSSVRAQTQEKACTRSDSRRVRVLRVLGGDYVKFVLCILVEWRSKDGGEVRD